jgi:hypothetical protein
MSLLRQLVDKYKSTYWNDLDDYDFERAEKYYIPVAFRIPMDNDIVFGIDGLVYTPNMYVQFVSERIILKHKKSAPTPISYWLEE